MIGYKWGIINDDYVPATDGSFERGLYNGLYYYFHGPVQVYNRAKFCRDNQLQGIFCWDLCNDLSPSHKYSLSRWCNYALSANVDPKVTEVTPNHPTGIHSPTVNGPLGSDASPSEESSPIYDLQGRQMKTEPQSGVFIRDGKKIVK